MTFLKMMIFFKIWSLSSVFLYLVQGSNGKPLIKESELENGAFVCLGSLPLGMVLLPTFVLLVDCQLSLLRTGMFSTGTQG